MLILLVCRISLPTVQAGPGNLSIDSCAQRYKDSVIPVAKRACVAVMALSAGLWPVPELAA